MVGPQSAKLLSVNVLKNSFTDITGPGMVWLVSWAALALVAAAGRARTPPGGALFAGMRRADTVVRVVALLPASRAGTGRHACRRKTPTLCGPRWCVVVNSPAGRGRGIWRGCAPSSRSCRKAVAVAVWCFHTPPLSFGLTGGAGHMFADGLGRGGLLSAQTTGDPLPVVRAVRLTEPWRWWALLVLRGKHTRVVICSEDEGDAFAFVVAGRQTVFKSRSPNAPVPELFATLKLLVRVAITGTVLLVIWFTSVSSPNDNWDACAGADCLNQMFVDPIRFLAGLVHEIVKVFWGGLPCSLVLKLDVIVDPGSFIAAAMFPDVFDSLKA